MVCYYKLISLKGIDVAISAFRQLDKNRNGILDKEDVILAFGYMDRLYNDNYFPSLVTSLEPKQPNTNLTQFIPPFDSTSTQKPISNQANDISLFDENKSILNIMEKEDEFENQTNEPQTLSDVQTPSVITPKKLSFVNAKMGVYDGDDE